MPKGKIGEKKDISYYIKCCIGGALACGLTHTAVTPLDVVKCRRQVDPNLYKSVGDGFKKIMAGDGVGGLFVGWGPTFVGYNLQGIGKFGFYEVFKATFTNILGIETAKKYDTFVYFASSACAEFFADIFLCPFEAAKVRVQTSKPGTFPTGFGAAMNKIKLEEG